MHTSHPPPLYPPLATSYKNHQKSMAYFSHLAPMFCSFFTERQSQKGGEGNGPMLPLPKYLPEYIIVKSIFAFMLKIIIKLRGAQSFPTRDLLSLKFAQIERKGYKSY